MHLKILQMIKTQDTNNDLADKHSPFYHLPPIGSGTSYAESLTSYILRLADKHCVTSQILLKKVIIPKMNKRYLNNPRKFLSKDSRTANGVTEFAILLGSVLMDMTLRRDLIHHTMLPWAGIIDPAGKGLLKIKRAWCPACFQEWHDSDSVIYEPLLWTIRVITKCVRHGISLKYSCPACKRSQPVLLSRAGVGVCYHCDSWLGVGCYDETLVEERAKARMLKKAQWLENAVGDMISSAFIMEKYPTSQDFLDALNRYSEKVTSGNVARLAQDVGMTPHTLRQWTRGRFRPRFDSLLDLCFRLKVTPVSLLAGDYAAITEKDLTTKAPHIRRRIRASKRPKLDKTTAENTLNAEMEKVAPKSIAGIARALKLKPSSLRYFWPKLCQDIAKKRRIRRRAKRQRDGSAKSGGTEKG